MHGKHHERLEEQLRLELAELIENEVADPRVGSVSVNGVRLSPDGKQVRVLITPLDAGVREKECLRGLERAKSFLRRELASRMPLRHTPDLTFTIDHGPEHAARVETLLARLKKRGGLTLLFLSGFLLVGRPPWAAPGPPAGLSRYENSAQAMGSLYTVAAYGEDRAQLSAAIGAALQEARRIDDLLSNYRSESELSEINREAAQHPVRVSPELFDLLEKCQQYSRSSDGAFDWTVGSLMRVWGFYKGSGRLPERAAVEEAMRSVGYQHVHLDSQARTVSFDAPGVELDPGGIGKGYAVDKMVEILRDAGIEIALISAAGSSIYAMGAPPAEKGPEKGSEKGWPIRIRDPRDETITAAELFLKDQSLSTSGTYEKFFETGGKIYSHIMDPRTGYPAKGMLSVSVVAPKTLDSEAWAKPFFINGPEWTRKHLPQGFRVFLCEEGKPCYWIP